MITVNQFSPLNYWSSMPVRSECKGKESFSTSRPLSVFCIYGMIAVTHLFTNELLKPSQRVFFGRGTRYSCPWLALISITPVHESVGGQEWCCVCLLLVLLFISAETCFMYAALLTMHHTPGLKKTRWMYLLDIKTVIWERQSSSGTRRNVKTERMPLKHTLCRKQLPFSLLVCGQSPFSCSNRYRYYHRWL